MPTYHIEMMEGRTVGAILDAIENTAEAAGLSIWFE